MNENTQDESPQADIAPAAQASGSGPSTKRRLSRKKRWLVGGLLTAAVLGIMLPAVASQTRGPTTPKQVRAKMERGADFAMEFLDGTDAQRAALNPILDGLSNDVANIHNEGRALRKSFVTALLADKLDEGHLEKVRADAIRLADRASKRMLKDVKQFHAVLTTEQRAKLRRIAAKMAKKHDARHGR